MIEERASKNGIVWQKKHYPQKRKKFDVELYLIDRENAWARSLKLMLRKYQTFKFDIKLTVRLQKIQDDRAVIYTNPCFRSGSVAILSSGSIVPSLRKTREKVLDAYDCFMKEGSGWTLNRVEFSELSVYKTKVHVGGGGGKAVVILPKSLQGLTNRSLVSFVPTKDNRCFLYCIMAHLFPPKKGKPHNPRHYVITGKIHLVDTTDLSYPTPLSQIPAFEERNNLVINVVGVNRDGRHRYLYLSPRKSGELINLLLYRKHYHLIKSWMPFLNCKSHPRRLCCSCGKLCLTSRMKTDRECINCLEPPISQLVFPEKGTVQKFSSFHRLLPNPFVLYCDIETVASGVRENDEGKKTKKLKRHDAIAIGLMRICQNERFSHDAPIIHVGHDCIEKFYDSLRKEVNYVEEILASTNYPIDMTETEEASFQSSKNCYACGVDFTEDPSARKCRDHDHLRAKNNYRGPICNSCNLNRTDLKLKIPLFFHNGGRFDVHFLLQKLHKLTAGGTMNVIAKTGENFMCLELFEKRVVVKDSFNHLSSSLAALVDQLKKGGKSLKITKRYLKGDEEKVELMSRKGVFPYGLVDSMRVLEETTSLPPKEAFYDTLREKDIEQGDYDHAKRVWDLLKCKNLREYMEHYLATDITFLADVMENYRNFFYTKFELDPSHYLSLPGLSYDCMLRFTKSEIELISDMETYSFVKRSLRGGVSMIPHRWAKANNPLLGETYDPSEPTTYLMYLDCNSLYSSIMTKSLPYRNLRWVNKTKEWVRKKVNTYQPSDERGYLIECDLAYPASIHDITKDLPLAPEHLKITRSMLSPFCERLSKRLNIKMDSAHKLVSTQLDKERYVCHIENLQFYLRQGMRLKRVHRILRFDQKPFLKPYIELCIKERRSASSPDEKSLWKLACNAIFGKTITNVEKRHNVKIHTSAAKVLQSVSSPLFKHADVITKNVVQTTSYKKRNLINTPFLIGTSILELSKLHLMKLHYEHFLPKYGIYRLKLCMTDTDSLLYLIRTEDVYSDLRETKTVDFSNYPPDNPFFDDSREGELFLLKDEAAGVPIKSFVGLRAKSYSIRYLDDSNKVTGKGIPKHKLSQITHDDLERTLRETIPLSVTSEYLRSFKHEVFTITQEKTALSAYDNKRFVNEDGISTLPIGHADTSRGE